MKKTLILILAVLMIFGVFAACSPSEKEEAPQDDQQKDAQSEATDDTQDDATDDTQDDASDDVQEDDAEEPEPAKETLVMATNAAFPPYEFYEGEEIVGIDAEIAQAIAEELGMELKILDMDFNAIIPAVQSGKADMGLAGMTVNEERLQNVNFSESYAKGVQVIIVQEGSDIKTIDDLDGVKIGVQQSTTGDIYASDDFGDAVVRYDNGGMAVVALTQGKVDAVIIDNEPAKAFVEANEGLVILETEYAVEDYAAAIAKENEELLGKINDALAKLKDSGKLQEIVDKYITAE